MPLTEHKPNLRLEVTVYQVVVAQHLKPSSYRNDYPQKESHKWKQLKDLSPERVQKRDM